MKNFREQFYKFKKSTEKFLDPFLVLALLLVFVVPAVAVLNLTPTWRTMDEGAKVLGTTDQDQLVLIPYQTGAQGLQLIEVNQTTETSYLLTLKNLAHEEGRYINKIFDIANPTQTQKQLAVEPSFQDVPDGTKVSIMIDEVKHVLLDTDGTSYPVGIYLQDEEEFPVYLVLESENDVNHTSQFMLDVNLE
jgi:hypothetical protein